MTFLGRPPFAPLALAAAVFTSERAFPPLRPRATAAGFLRDIGARHVFNEDEFATSARKRDVARWTSIGGDRDAVDGSGLSVSAGVPMAGGNLDAHSLFHTAIKPNRLGFVNH